MWYPVWTQQQSRVRSRAAHPLCDQCSHSCGIPGRGHEAHRGSQQQARPPVTASSLAGPGPATGSADSGLWWPPAPAAAAQSGQDKQKQEGPPCTRLSGPCKPEPSWAGGQAGGLPRGLRNPAREGDEAQVSRTPPQPLHPRNHRQQHRGHSLGQGHGAVGGGGAGSSAPAPARGGALASLKS